MEKYFINEAVSSLDLQGSNVKESAVEDKDLQASASASDAPQFKSGTNKGMPVQVNGNGTDDKKAPEEDGKEP